MFVLIAVACLWYCNTLDHQRIPGIFNLFSNIHSSKFTRSWSWPKPLLLPASFENLNVHHLDFMYVYVFVILSGLDNCTNSKIHYQCAKLLYPETKSSTNIFLVSISCLQWQILVWVFCRMFTYCTSSSELASYK